MSVNGIPAKVGEALDYLAEDNLYAYSLERMSEFLVGLKTVVLQDLPIASFSSSYPIPTMWLERLIEACSAIRRRLSALHVDEHHGARKTLQQIINHIDWLFSCCYHITQRVIDEERLNHRVYQLLCELNLVESGFGFMGAWDASSYEETKLMRQQYKQELLDFVKQNPEEVVSAVFSITSSGGWHLAEMRPDRERLFKIFDSISFEKNNASIEYLS
jgi:hypothetical protein